MCIVEYEVSGGVFTLKDLEVLYPRAREGGDSLENIEINPLEMRRLIKELDLQKKKKTREPDGILPFAWKVCGDPYQTTGGGIKDLPR